MTTTPLGDIRETDFQLWRHHPVTALFLQYLRDYREVLRREALDRWEAGALNLVDQQEMRGRVMTCAEMADLPFEAIRSFYEGEKTENEASSA